MANNPVSDTTNKSTIATRAGKPKASSPAKKPAAKTKPKPAVKSTAKPTAKAKIKTAKSVVSKNAQTKKAMPAKADIKTKPKNIASPKTINQTKPKKSKLIRDSFTMPDTEYDLIAAVKKRCVAKGVAVKKSEVLRAAIISFAALSDATAMTALQALDVIKTGRKPKG